MRKTKAFREKMRARREALGLSVRDLAKLVGVDVHTAFSWETGEHAIRFKRIERLARALKVAPSTISDWMMGR